MVCGNWNVDKHIFVISVTKVQKIKLKSIHGIISFVSMVVSISMVISLMVLIGVMVSMIVV